MTAPITNGEAGSSVRTKLNTTIAKADTALQVVAAADITDATATGQAAMTAADAAALATAAGLTNVDNTSDADKPISNATQGALDDKAAVSFVDDLVQTRRPSLGKGIYSDGTVVALTVPQQTITDLGRLDHTKYLPTFILASWTPAANTTLLTNESGNTGLRVVLATTGALELQIGDGSTWTSYTTTKTISEANYTAVTITVTLARSGLAVFWINGVSWDSVDISAQSGVDLTTTAAWDVLPAAAGWIAGQFASVLGLSTAAEIAAAHAYPDTLRRMVEGELVYASDFTIDADGWTEEYGADYWTFAGAQTIGGEAGWFTGTANADQTGVVTHIRPVELASLSAGQAAKTARVSVRFHVNSENTQVDSFNMIQSSTVVGMFSNTVPGTEGFSVQTYDPGTAAIRFSPKNAIAGGLTTMTAGEIFGLKDLRYELIGIVELIDLSVAGATKNDLIGTNNATSGGSDTL